MKRVVTQTVVAWLTENKYTKAEAVLNPKPVDMAYIATGQDMSGVGWVRVGTAEITLTIDDGNDVTTAVIDRMRSRAGMIRAEAERHLTNIEGHIQSLLSLPNEVSP